jgi:hypothetical protein
MTVVIMKSQLRMRIVLLIFTCFLLAVPNSPLKTSPIPPFTEWEGDYFSEIQSLNSSSYVQSIRLQKNGKFYLYRILLHPEKKWEESRYEGRWEKSRKSENSDISLQVESCRYYTSRNLMDRRALLRAFDCEHVVMGFKKTENIQENLDETLKKSKFVLSPDQYGNDHSAAFFRFLPLQTNPYAIVISVEEDQLAWGIDLSRFKSNQVAKLLSPNGTHLQDVKLVEIVETSFRWKSDFKDSIPIGSFIQLPKK